MNSLLNSIYVPLNSKKLFLQSCFFLNATTNDQASVNLWSKRSYDGSAICPYLGISSAIPERIDSMDTLKESSLASAYAGVPGSILIYVTPEDPFLDAPPPYTCKSVCSPCPC